MKSIYNILFIVGRLIFAWLAGRTVNRPFREERKNGTLPDRERWEATISPWPVLTFAIGFAAIRVLIWPGVTSKTLTWLSASYSVLFTGAVYYTVLMLMLPLLRKKVNARTCSLMWLLPGFLYWSFMPIGRMDHPLIVWKIPLNVSDLFGIWFLCALAIFIFRTAGHMRFRCRILKGIRPAEGETLELWNRIQEEIRDPHLVDYKPLKLWIASETSTPITVGVLKSKVRVLLPDKQYTPEELRLIFRHELAHIYRRDASTKMAIAVWNALMWFVPFTWRAGRRIGEDIELCVDELVLAGRDNEREDYARLILNAAADPGGFTTSLASDAGSLKYRLVSVMKPVRKRTGTVLVALTAACITLSCNMLTLAHAPMTLSQAALDGAAPQAVRYRHAYDVSWEQMLAETGISGETLDEVRKSHEMKEEYLAVPEISFGDTTLAESMEGVLAERIWDAIGQRTVYEVLGGYEIGSFDLSYTVLTLPTDDINAEISIRGRYVWIQTYSYPSLKELSGQLYVMKNEIDWASIAQSEGA